jgi:hypothetical protein
MFGQVLDRINSWLGPSFILSYFLPWVLFAIANLVMIYHSYPAAALAMDPYLTMDGVGKAIILLVGSALLGVAAFITSPLIQGLTEILEGRPFPSKLAANLTKIQTDDLDRIELELNRLGNMINSLTQNQGADVVLATAKQIGDSGRRIMAPESIADAETAINSLRQARRANALVDPAHVIRALSKLEDALKQNCSDAGNLVVPVAVAGADEAAIKVAMEAATTEWKLSQQLDNLFSEFLDQLYDYPRNIAEQRRTELRIVRYSRFARTAMAPTRLGNYAAALRSYCETRYAMDFDFFWPRLQAVFQKDEKLSENLSTAKVRLDFAVLSLWLSVIFTAAWLLVLPLASPTPSVALLIGIAVGGPVVAMMWLGLVHTSYFTYAELIRSSIDFKRHELLDAFKMEAPADLAAEKKTWENLGYWLLIGRQDIAVTFAKDAAK